MSQNLEILIINKNTLYFNVFKTNSVFKDFFSDIVYDNIKEFYADSCNINGNISIKHFINLRKFSA
jgi:hypothetical protein